MVKVIYNFSAFDSSQASSGKLCVMVKNTVSDTTQNFETVDDYGVVNTNYGGAGLCKVTGSNEYTLRIDGIDYAFNHLGKPANYTARDGSWKLVMGTVVKELSEVGSDVTGYQVVTTRGGTDEGSTIDYTETKLKAIDSLTARDQFAAQALRGMLGHIEDPATLSKSEINFYCNMAYEWAANMMAAAADTRVNEMDYQGETPTSDVEVGDLETNTEKLLNNLILELAKTNINVGSAQDPHYAERISNPGMERIVNDYLKHTEGGVTTIRNYDDLLNTLVGIKNAITSGGGGGSSFDGNIVSMPNVNIGSSGIGRDSDHPIYISGGGFPTKSALAAEFYGDTAHGQVNKAEDFVAFNYNGAVGYITADELAKRMNINTLISSALSAKLAGAYVEVGGTRYNVVFPNV